MNASVDRTLSDTTYDNLDVLRDEILLNINNTIQGNADANLTAELTRYFIEGISGFYVNFTFGIGSAGSTTMLSEMQRTCAENATYTYLFPPVEQAKIASLGNNLQQIKVAYDVARAVSVYCLVM